ncbi:MAG TPA: hypothetical protein VMJ75_27420, partial [Candidatus Acidoferrales bacterium]|nr:hypothetical protein [Candidatus Acidoferrales bacterium]
MKALPVITTSIVEFTDEGPPHECKSKTATGNSRELPAGQRRAAPERTAHRAPGAPGPFGTYAEDVQTGNLLFLAGMLPLRILGRKAQSSASQNSKTTQKEDTMTQ